MMPRPVEARRPGPPESGTAYSAPTIEPLAGVSSPVITAAARRVAQRIRDDGIDAPDMDIVAAVLAAIALAVDQQRPRYVTELVHRASPTLGARLLELLRSEVIHAWATGPGHLTPPAMLTLLGAIERVREAIEPDSARPPGSPLPERRALPLARRRPRD